VIEAAYQFDTLMTRRRAASSRVSSVSVALRSVQIPVVGIIVVSIPVFVGVISRIQITG
jgi:hypothetical protein